MHFAVVLVVCITLRVFVNLSKMEFQKMSTEELRSWLKEKGTGDCYCEIFEGECLFGCYYMKYTLTYISTCFCHFEIKVG